MGDPSILDRWFNFALAIKENYPGIAIGAVLGVILGWGAKLMPSSQRILEKVRIWAAGNKFLLTMIGTFVAFILASFSVFDSKSQDVAKLSQDPAAKLAAEISIDYKPERPWVTPPEDRPDYPNSGVYAIRISTRTRLTNATVLLTSIVKEERNTGKWSRPLNDHVPFIIGWAGGPFHSFERHTLSISDYWNLFITYNGGTRLQLFCDPAIPECHRFDSMEDGRYKLTIIFDADAINGLKRDVVAEWRAGESEPLVMRIVASNNEAD